MKKTLGTIIAIMMVAILIGTLIMVKYATAGETSKDGRFIAFNNGTTVLDKRTGLMWAAKDNGSNISWIYARAYCETYHGGGFMDWRMPTQKELIELYDESETYTSDCGWKVHLTELIHLTCWRLWASGTNGSYAASFGFSDGYGSWDHQSGDNSYRALPVRRGR